MIEIITLTTILLLLMIFLIRRGRNSTPGETLGIYLDALIGGRTEESYSCLSSVDRTRETLSEYRMRRSLGSGLIANLIARHVSFTIEATETDPGRATAVATVTAPDFTRIAGDVLQETGSAGLPSGNLDAFILICQKISHFLDKYQGEAIPLRTDTASFLLILEKGGWKIRLEDR